MGLTREQKINKEYRDEAKAAWAAMSKRFDKALAKRDRELEKLRDETHPYGREGAAAKQRVQADVPRRSSRPGISERPRPFRKP